MAEEIDELSHELHEVRTFEHLVLSPIAILVGILALGGGLGIVFSIRDQRRVSQLHELTVGSEILSQRRSEQGYASFLEQSQTTLALVNDTLKLAKEGSDLAVQNMQLKAKSQIDAIEEQAERLMFEVFGTREFHAVVDRSAYRGEVLSTGEALRSLEGYFGLQEIQLPHYARFVKAIDRFLLDEAEAALQELRRLSQAGLPSELRRFCLYWLGYLYTTVGAYEQAGGIFSEDEDDLSDYGERFQLEHMIKETRFFEKAKARRDSEGSDSTKDLDEPRNRFESVASILDELDDLAVEIDSSPEGQAVSHVRLDVARTRADIYTWIAYDPKRINAPFERSAVEEAEQIIAGQRKRDEGAERAVAEQDRDEDSPALEDDLGGAAVALISTPEWGELADHDSPDVLRAWAMIQAKEICTIPGTPNFDIAFALAECQFKLGDEDAVQTFEKAEHMLGDEAGEHREKRKKATLRQSALICHRRLLSHKKDKEEKEEKRQVAQAATRAHEAVDGMRPGRVTIFSQIQRCNVDQDDFKAEIKRIANYESTVSTDDN